MAQEISRPYITISSLWIKKKHGMVRQGTCSTYILITEKKVTI